MDQNNFARRVIRRLNTNAGIYPPEVQAFIDTYCSTQPNINLPLIIKQHIPDDIDVRRALGWPEYNTVVCLPEVDYEQS